MKNCTKCKADKEEIEFPMNGKRLRSICKACIKLYKEQWGIKNINRMKEYKKQYAIDNKETLKKYHKKYHIKNAVQIIKRVSDYQSKNWETIKPKRQLRAKLKEVELKKYYKNYYETNKEKIRVKVHLAYIKNGGKEKNRQYRIKNKERLSEARKQRKLRDPLFKLSLNIRKLIYSSFKNQFTKKSKKTVEILCCSFAEFKTHLESRFTKDMNWSNHGSYWEMDHITPVSWAKDEKELYELNHYTNFQPLTIIDNRIKSNNYAG